MSHEMFNLAKASPDQLDLALGGIVVGGVVLAVAFFLLMTWSKRKEAARGKTHGKTHGKTRGPRAAAARSAKRRSG